MAFNVDRCRSIVNALVHRGCVSPADVAWLRREVFVDGEVSREMADDLFAVERSDIEKCPEWTEFLVEMITEHVVWQSRPTGIVNESQAEWLIARTDECRSIGALAALVNVLTEAHRVPQWLAGAAHAGIRRGGRRNRLCEDALAAVGPIRTCIPPTQPRPPRTGGLFWRGGAVRGSARSAQVGSCRRISSHDLGP
jgi:hypothetical protein